jgi:hypothetical protein
VTLAWNVVGIAVLPWAAVEASSVALAGFGLDSLMEIGASVVVLWELADVDAGRQRRALRLIGIAFVGVCLYVAINQSSCSPRATERAKPPPASSGPR